jgi:hypothetical protein
MNCSTELNLIRLAKSIAWALWWVMSSILRPLLRRGARAAGSAIRTLRRAE